MASLDKGSTSGSVATDTIFDAKGDIIAGTGADTSARLPVGTNGQILSAASGEATGLDWIDNDLTAHTGDTSDAHDASAISVDSTTLVGTGTDVQAVFEELDNSIVDHAAAADPHTGYVLESLFDAAGDLIIASADNTPAKLTRGSDDQFLRSTGSTVAWESVPFSIVAFLDGAGSTLATGRRPIWNAAFPCTVTAVKAYVDTGTTTVVNAGTTATAGAEEFCSADITIDPADAWESGTVDQNQAITAGETVGVEVITAGTATQITIQIDLTRP